MTLELYSSSFSETLGEFLPQLRDVAPSVVWILPAGLAWEMCDAQLITGAFQDLRGIIWFASDGGERTTAIKNRLRAFGSWSTLINGAVAERTLTYHSSQKKIYSDIAWLDSEAHQSLVSFLSRSTVGADSTISFIPNGQRFGEKWTNAVCGLEWLWLLGQSEMTTSSRLLSVDTILSLYVRLTIGNGGVAGLIFDVKGKTGLALVGVQDVLDAAVNQMINSNYQPTKGIFEQWYRDGLHLRAAP